MVFDEWILKNSSLLQLLDMNVNSVAPASATGDLTDSNPITNPRVHFRGDGDRHFLGQEADLIPIPVIQGNGIAIKAVITVTTVFEFLSRTQAGNETLTAVEGYACGLGVETVDPLGRAELGIDLTALAVSGIIVVK